MRKTSTRIFFNNRSVVSMLLRDILQFFCLGDYFLNPLNFSMVTTKEASGMHSYNATTGKIAI